MEGGGGGGGGGLGGRGCAEGGGGPSRNRLRREAMGLTNCLDFFPCSRSGQRNEWRHAPCMYYMCLSLGSPASFLSGGLLQGREVEGSSGLGSKEGATEKLRPRVKGGGGGWGGVGGGGRKCPSNVCSVSRQLANGGSVGARPSDNRPGHKSASTRC